MNNSSIRLRILDQSKDSHLLQQILEGAPRYSINILGKVPSKNAAEEVFFSIPDGFDRGRKFVLGIDDPWETFGCIDFLRGYPKEDTAMLGLFLLKENKQKRGLGRAAFDIFESYLNNWSVIKIIRIGVVQTNKEVLEFWKKLGFKETGALKPYQNGEVISNTIILEKPLT